MTDRGVASRIECVDGNVHDGVGMDGRGHADKVLRRLLGAGTTTGCGNE